MGTHLKLGTPNLQRMYFPPELYLILILLSFLAILALPAPPALPAAPALVQFDTIAVRGPIHYCFSAYVDNFLVSAHKTSLFLIMPARSAYQMIKYKDDLPQLPSTFSKICRIHSYDLTVPLLLLIGCGT